MDTTFFPEKPVAASILTQTFIHTKPDVTKHLLTQHLSTQRLM